MKNEELAGAATDLWKTRMGVIRIHEQLEDEDGGLGRSHRVIEEKFTAVIELLEELSISVDEADNCVPKVARPPLATSELK